MSDFIDKNVLIIIPKSQFCEEELYGIRSVLESHGVRVVVLSKSGQKAYGMKRDEFQPDGMIVDWDRQLGVQGKYHAVILVGGKGARKSLWDDPIIPQILTDHYRFGSLIGAVGEALTVFVRASLITGEIPLPKDAYTQKELKNLGAVCVDTPIISSENIVLGQGLDSIDQFSQVILDFMEIREVC